MDKRIWRERLWEKESFNTRVENARTEVNKWSRIRAWRWRRAGWWWRIELIRNTKSRNKFVPQVRCGVLEGVVCDLETEVNWWLKKSDQCGWSSGFRRLDCDEITQVMWRRRLEELNQGGPKNRTVLEVCNSRICWHRIAFYISNCSVFYPE